jgi:hypothetical protein
VIKEGQPEMVALLFLKLGAKVIRNINSSLLFKAKASKKFAAKKSR